MEHGIELLKNLTTDIVVLLKKYKESREDEETTKAEMFGIAAKILPVLKDFVQYKALLEEAKDIDTEEGMALLAHVVSLGVVNNKAEIVATNVILIIKKELEVYESNIKPIIEALKS